MTRLEKQIQFIVEVDKVKNIFRQTYLADGERKENDAEHSWHLALSAILLKEYVSEEIDLLKVITMVLIHDIVEIDAVWERKIKESVKKRQRIAFSIYFRQSRDSILENYGKSLSHMKRRTPNTLICLIIFSQCC